MDREEPRQSWHFKVTAHQHVVSIGVEIVEDLTIDWIRRDIYLTDLTGCIYACDLQIGFIIDAVAEEHTDLDVDQYRHFSSRINWLTKLRLEDSSFMLALNSSLLNGCQLGFCLTLVD